MIGINPDADYLLDPQQATPAGWCPVCGTKIWEDGQELCRRCRRNPQEKTFHHIFEVKASTPMMRGLRAFLDAHHYEYHEECSADV